MSKKIRTLANDSRNEIVPQKFGHEFVNYWD